MTNKTSEMYERTWNAFAVDKCIRIYNANLTSIWKTAWEQLPWLTIKKRVSFILHLSFWSNDYFLIVLCSSNAALLTQCTFGTNQLKGTLDMWETECVQLRWVLPPCSRPLATLWPSTRLFMWFLSNCIIWSKATGRLCPTAPTLLAGKKKGNIWQELTEPKWDHWLFWRRGVATHPSACCLIMLAVLTIEKKKTVFFSSPLSM